MYNFYFFPCYTLGEQTQSGCERFGFGLQYILLWFCAKYENEDHKFETYKWIFWTTEPFVLLYSCHKKTLRMNELNDARYYPCALLDFSFRARAFVNAHARACLTKQQNSIQTGPGPTCWLCCAFLPWQRASVSSFFPRTWRKQRR